MSTQNLADSATHLASEATALAQKAANLALEASHIANQSGTEGGFGFMALFTVFVLACFVGYYVVWRVTPALHSPLMAVTNAVSSVIIVGALVAAATQDDVSNLLGFFGIILASINIFGGFIVTQRMLSMFKKKQK